MLSCDNIVLITAEKSSLFWGDLNSEPVAKWGSAVFQMGA